MPSIQNLQKMPKQDVNFVTKSPSKNDTTSEFYRINLKFTFHQQNLKAFPKISKKYQN